MAQKNQGRAQRCPSRQQSPGGNLCRLAPGPPRGDEDKTETQPAGCPRPGAVSGSAASLARAPRRRGRPPRRRGAGAGPPGWLRPGSQGPLPAPVHAGSGRTDTRTAAKPYGTHRRGARTPLARGGSAQPPAPRRQAGLTFGDVSDLRQGARRGAGGREGSDRRRFAAELQGEI